MPALPVSASERTEQYHRPVRARRGFAESDGATGRQAATPRLTGGTPAGGRRAETANDRREICALRPSQALELLARRVTVCVVETTYDSKGLHLGKLADVFGDPTRRGIYRHLRLSEDPLSASEVGEAFGLHRTVARAHLEKLKDLELVECGTRRRAGGGRPAKTYVLADGRLEIMLPPRRYERLARLLLRLIDASLDPVAAAAAATDLGRAYGADAALSLLGADAKPPVKLSPQALVGWMDTAGYGVSLDDGAPGVVAVKVSNCVYRELSQEYPGLVCRFDCGLVCGMLGVDQSAHTQTHALSAGDAFCRHEIRL